MDSKIDSSNYVLLNSNTRSFLDMPLGDNPLYNSLESVFVDFTLAGDGKYINEILSESHNSHYLKEYQTITQSIK